MKLIVGIDLGNIGKTDAVGKNENIMIYAPSDKRCLKTRAQTCSGFFILLYIIGVKPTQNR